MWSARVSEFYFTKNPNLKCFFEGGGRGIAGGCGRGGQLE